MAQKFGNGRWVEEGFLDNRIPGTVVGRVSFAGIGRVEVFLAGDFRGEIAGQAIRFPLGAEAPRAGGGAGGLPGSGGRGCRGEAVGGA